MLTDGEPVVIADRRGRKSLLCLRAGQTIHVADGGVACDEVIGQPSGVRLRSTKGEVLAIFRPTLGQFIELMPRAAQIISPKDIAQIVLWADVAPGATVVEAGVGSGGLTLGLLRAVGPGGRVIAFEMRSEFANRAVKNVEMWDEALKAQLDLRLEDVHQNLGALSDVDAVVLDLQDPWLSLPGVVDSLTPGGVFLAYLPTIRQVDQLVVAILDQKGLAAPEVVEIIERPWVAERVRLRPANRMVGHTGFLVRCRRLGPAP